MTQTDLSPLIGRWSGRGRGDYPTIQVFEYLEHVTITLSPKGFLTYQQTTSDPGSGAPMHSESGFFRPLDDGRVEFVVAQPNGVCEAHSGRARHDQGGFHLDLHATTIGRTETAKHVDGVSRRIMVNDEVLSYELHLGAVGQPLQVHLLAELHREP